MDRSRKANRKGNEVTLQHKSQQEAMLIEELAGDNLAVDSARAAVQRFGCAWRGPGLKVTCLNPIWCGIRQNLGRSRYFSQRTCDCERVGTMGHERNCRARLAVPRETRRASEIVAACPEPRLARCALGEQDRAAQSISPWHGRGSVLTHHGRRSAGFFGGAVWAAKRRVSSSCLIHRASSSFTFSGCSLARLLDSARSLRRSYSSHGSPLAATSFQSPARIARWP